MDTRIEKKVMPLPKEPREGIFPRSEETDTVRNKDGVYEFWWNRNNASKGGSIPDLVWWSMDFEDPQTLTYFLLASPNLEDEIHFKGGRNFGMLH